MYWVASCWACVSSEASSVRVPAPLVLRKPLTMPSASARLSCAPGMSMRWARPGDRAPPLEQAARLAARAMGKTARAKADSMGGKILGRDGRAALVTFNCGIDRALPCRKGACGINRVVVVVHSRGDRRSLRGQLRRIFSASSNFADPPILIRRRGSSAYGDPNEIRVSLRAARSAFYLRACLCPVDQGNDVKQHLGDRQC